MDSLPIETIIATELSATPRQIRAAIRLLDDGATVPFIARYRKEATGGLSDVHLRMLADRLEYLRELERRRLDILQSLEEQGKLGEALKAAVLAAETKAALEDLYLPFRPKKQSKAQSARDAGLGALADKLLSPSAAAPEALAAEFADPLKGVADAAAALEGAREILVEKFSEDAALVGRLRDKFRAEGWIFSRAVPGKEAAGEKFSDYFNFRERLGRVPSHRALALFRGRQEGVLRVTLETEGFGDYGGGTGDADYIQAVASHFGLGGRRGASWLQETVRRAWKYKLRLHLELDLMMELRKSAEEEGIRVFAENLRNLLLAPPAGPRATLGLDPGFRTGVKAAVVDRTGRVLETATIYPHAPQDDWAQASRTLALLMKKHAVELVAVGNGTGSRETEALVDSILKLMPELKAKKAVVSEAGASVYSASALASAELPSLDVTLRGAVSIARRFQDPLAELVKIEPKAIGVGQYQHDVNQRRLEQMLKNVVEDCVNAVGVDANTASPSLLSYVSGFTKRTAEDFVAFRGSRGGFKNRLEFLSVPGLGPRVFEQAAGFLRIREGDNPLDASSVHPESYPVVERLLSVSGRTLKEALGNRAFLSSVKAADFADGKTGEPTVRDILEELEKPGRDPRPEFRTAVFREDLRTLEDLKPGMALEGTVTNVANFGAFVDLGVHQDGLVHVSEISDRFVQDPHEVLKAGQVVRVRVLEVDPARRRISLSMRSSSGQKTRPALR